MDGNLIHSLSKEQEDLILTDIGYTREQLKADVKQIREWIQQQHHLPPSRLKEKDSFFEWYLTSCKGSLEAVKRKLDNYYTMRSYSELFEVRDPAAPDYLAVRNMCQSAIMPHAGYNGDRLTISKFADIEPDKFDFLNFGRSQINASEVIMRCSGIASRYYVILDCKGASPSIGLKIKPSVMRDLAFLLEDVLPYRIIKIGFVNTPSYVDVAVNNIMKPLLPKKIKERFYVTSGGYEDVFNYFSRDILPSDYGGPSSNPTLKDYTDLWIKNEQANRSWFLNELSERTDESKRINIDKISKNPYFGVHGSLKKLIID